MADLKTYLGISDTDIKSVSGLPANDTKTILGSLLNQGGSNEAEVDTYIDGLETELSSDQITRLNTFVAALKTGLSITNLSDAFDVMYILAGETEESSLKNLVKNAHHAQAVNSPTFTQYEGFTGNGTSSYLDTNYNTNSDSSVFKSDDAGFGFYSRGGRTANNISAGTGNVNTSIKIWATTVNGRYYCNSVSYTQVSSGYYSEGFYGVYRTGNDVYGYKNNVQSSVLTQEPTVANCNLYIGCINNNGVPVGFDIIQISFLFAGKYLSAAQHDIVFDIIEAYMDANGKGVIS